MEYIMEELIDQIKYIDEQYGVHIQLVKRDNDNVDITTEDDTGTLTYYYNATIDVAMVFLYGFVKGYKYNIK